MGFVLKQEIFPKIWVGCDSAVKKSEHKASAGWCKGKYDLSVAGEPSECIMSLMDNTFFYEKDSGVAISAMNYCPYTH